MTGLETSNNDKWLDAVLRASEPSITDDGFSDAVLAQIPHRRMPWRDITVGASALIGVLMALFLTDFSALSGLVPLTGNLMEPAVNLPAPFSALGAPAILAALAAAGLASAYAALRHDVI